MTTEEELSVRWETIDSTYPYTPCKPQKSIAYSKFFLDQQESREKEIQKYRDKMPKTPVTEEEEAIVRQCNKTIRKLKRTHSCMVAPDKDVFKMTKRRIDDICFEEDKMTIWTKQIIIPYYVESYSKTVYVPMGKFKVECFFDNGTTVFYEFADNRVFQDRLHPHLGDGYPSHACWGSFGNMIAKSYNNCDICCLINTIVDFLNHCDREGWYCSIFGFMKPAQRAEFGDICTRCEYDPCECEDWCHGCDNHVDDCNCNWCSDCDRRDDECECVRCPPAGSVLDDNTFPDRHCFSCEHFVKNKDTNDWVCAYRTSPQLPYFNAPIQSFNEPQGTYNYRTYVNGDFTKKEVAK